MTTLEVWMYGSRAGTLRQESGPPRFAYDADWIAEGGPQLSHSLAVQAAAFEGEVVRGFFSNLLPEGEVRDLLARRLGISAGNDLALLGAIGGDCAGAVSIVEPGAGAPIGRSSQVRWLDEAELAAAVADLHSRPLLADPDEGIRLSLAGAQDKLPVVCHEGRVGIPVGGTPSTHILKPRITRFDDTVVNEAFCLAAAAAMGLDAAPAEVRRAEDQEFLLIERYDRDLRSAGVERIHQEDFCQGLAIPPDRKYEAEGGPGTADCIRLVRDVSAQPARDVLRFVDALVLNFLIGNHDAHGKNFSLLYPREGARLAPLYDVISTTVYAGLSRKMAMKIGGEYRPDYVRRRHIDRFARDAGLGARALRSRVRGTAARAPGIAGDTLRHFHDRGLHRPVLDLVLQTCERRAAQLLTELGTG